MQRPTTATVFGILNIVFGAFGICGSIMGAVGLAAQSALKDAAGNIPNPALELMQQSKLYSTFALVGVVLGLIASIALLTAGIGLLKMQPWGRSLSIGYAIYAIVMGIVGTVVNYVVVVGPMIQRLGDMPEGPEKAGMLGGAIGGSIGGCFGLIYPIVLLVFMTRPAFTAAIQGTSKQATPFA